MPSLGVDEHFLGLLLLFKFAFVLTNANVLLLPILGANGVSARLHYHSLESVHSLAHLLVQLLLHRLQVEGHVLAETGQELHWLHHTLGCLHVALGQSCQSNIRVRDV